MRLIRLIFPIDNRGENGYVSFGDKGVARPKVEASVPLLYLFLGFKAQKQVQIPKSKFQIKFKVQIPEKTSFEL